MKAQIYSLLLILFFYQHQHVRCFDVVSFVAKKITNLLEQVIPTLKRYENNVKDFFIDRESEKKTDKPFYNTNQRIKKAFLSFVQSNTVEFKTDSQDYLNVTLDSSALMTTPELALLHSRRVESHVILTTDGYFLTLHHVMIDKNVKLMNQTVLLHHGILGSSADWILLGAEASLPYLLSDAGYEVWMVNARGNYYSRNHVTLKTNTLQFWNFSWQEMGQYDLPAVIDYIRSTKESNEPINYIGHSMGATVLLALLSTVPIYNTYLRIGILLAPLAFMTDIQGPLKAFSIMAAQGTQENLLDIISINGEFLPSRMVPEYLATKYCEGPKLYCRNPLLFTSGGISRENTLDKSFVARLLYHVPAGGSANTILHYSQIMRNKKFHKFGNISDEFPLNRVTLPIALISSSEDWLATVPDVTKLYLSIPNPIDHHIIRDKKIKHTEFVWGAEANVWVFSKVLDVLKNGLDHPIKTIQSNAV